MTSHLRCSLCYSSRTDNRGVINLCWFCQTTSWLVQLCSFVVCQLKRRCRRRSLAVSMLFWGFHAMCLLASLTHVTSLVLARLVRMCEKCEEETQGPRSWSRLSPHCQWEETWVSYDELHIRHVKVQYLYVIPLEKDSMYDFRIMGRERTWRRIS